MDIDGLKRVVKWLNVLLLLLIIVTVVNKVTSCSRDKGEPQAQVIPPPPDKPLPPIKDNGEPLSIDEIEQAMLDDISRPELNAADRLNYRYLVLSDIFNEGESVTEPGLAIQKTVNQISSERFLKSTVPIDEDKTIYRVDLRDYFGSRGAVVWQLVEAKVPIKIISQTIRGKTLQFLTQAVEPWMHGRLFAETALTGKVYYDIVKIPSTLALFYKDFIGVIPQVEFDNRDPGLTLVGTQGSQISQNNRLSWRLDGGKNGAVYQTFDVDNNNVTAAQNLFENPFVVEVNPAVAKPAVTAKIFKHAASEVIGYLPNGMFAFALFDAAGVRANAAPQTVVNNVRAIALGLSSEIQNARDCTGCHQSGFITIKDEVGAQIQRSSNFNEVDKQLGQLFFKKQNVNDAFMAKDNSVYTDSLKELGIKGGPDPINEGLLDAIRTGVNLKEAASFLFIDEQTLSDGIKASNISEAQVGTLVRGGEVSFAQFVNSAPQIIKDLNLFIDVE